MHTFAHTESQQVPDDTESHRSPAGMPTQQENVIGCGVYASVCVCMHVTLLPGFCNMSAVAPSSLTDTSARTHTLRKLQPGCGDEYLSAFGKVICFYHTYKAVTSLPSIPNQIQVTETTLTQTTITKCSHLISERVKEREREKMRDV